MSPFPPSYHILIQGGKITCTPGNGNGRFRQGTAMQWDSNETCTLLFYTYDSNKQVPDWPFEGNAPTPPQVAVQPGTPFVGTLKPVASGQEAPSYAYSIKAGSQVLDPIIIVDK
jgi:hypothetical protein